MFALAEVLLVSLSPLALAAPTPSRDKLAMQEVQTDKIGPSMQQLGIEIFKDLSKEKGEENCFISPASIGICLQLVLAGASGHTRADLAKALHLNESDLDGNAMKNFLASLKTDDPKVTMEIANAVFAAEGLKLKESFVKEAKNNFDSEVRTENFNSPSAVQHVNQWCSEKTKGHIKKLADKLPASTAAVLLNAIYFFGKWTEPFNVKKTKDGDFHLAGGATKKLAMMNANEKFYYLENDQFQAVSLPYGARRYEALIFLPKPSVKLAQLRDQLTVENWQQWKTSFGKQKGYLELPRFKMEFGSSLKQVLQHLGMADMFSDKADFTGMATPPPPLTVGDVIHKTTLRVDEEGTVATAVTGAVMMAMARRMEPPPFKMIVDHPFIFAINDTKTDLPIFIGGIYNPDTVEAPHGQE